MDDQPLIALRTVLDQYERSQITWGAVRKVVEAFAAALAREQEAQSFPQKEFDALLDHIYEHGTIAEGVKERAQRMIRAAQPAAQEPSKDTPPWMQGMAHNIAVEYMREGQQRNDLERDIVNAMKEAAREVALAFAAVPKASLL